MAELDGARSCSDSARPDRLLANINTPEDYARIQYPSSSILPVHVRRSASALRPTRSAPQRFGLARGRAAGRSCIETPPQARAGRLAVPVAFELARRLRKAPRAIAQELAAGRSDRSTASRASRPRRTATSTSISIAPRSSRARLRRRASPAAAGRRRQGHRRAHGDQPEQGGAHRPSAQRRARRHAGPAAALSGPARRGAELHRRHRRAGRRRRRRLHVARRTRPGGRPRAGGRSGRAVRLLLLGSLRARDRVVRGRQDARSRCARTRSTPSRRAATTLAEMGAFIADRIVRCHLRHDGADERRTTTCSRGKATSCACISGRRRSSS